MPGSTRMKLQRWGNFACHPVSYLNRFRDRCWTCCDDPLRPNDSDSIHGIRDLAVWAKSANKGCDYCRLVITMHNELVATHKVDLTGGGQYYIKFAPGDAQRHGRVLRLSSCHKEDGKEVSGKISIIFYHEFGTILPVSHLLFTC